MAWFRKAREFFDESIVSNWHFKLIAALAALIIWSYVASRQTLQISFAVPIRFQNIPVGTRLNDQRVDIADVTLAGRRDRILTLKQKEIWVSLDLSGLRAGRNLYLISTRDVIVPAAIEVKDITPRQLSIQLVPETILP
jgi:YbbR domain-containing protein